MRITLPPAALCTALVFLMPVVSHAAEHKPTVEEIILIYKSHFDIGYTHLASETIHNYRTTAIDAALKVVDENNDLPPDQRFVWTIPGWPMKKILEDWDGQTPERRQRIRDAFRDGRFAVHALPATLQVEVMEPEGIVRSLRHASDLARHAGKPLPTGAKMTDVPSYSSLTPTLLKHAGVNFLHLGCNPGSTPPEVPFLFWWQGPDGSRLLTMYSTDYGNELLPPADWKYKTWIAMRMGSDNHPPPGPAAVRADIKTLQEKFPAAKIRLGTLGDFGDRMATEELHDLPVVTGDMPDSWIHGTMCDPGGMILTRKAMPDLLAAETLNTLLSARGIEVPDVASHIADGHENVMLYCEHTWGGAVDWSNRYLPAINGIGQLSNWFYGDRWKADLAAGTYNRHLISWEEHTEYARKAAHHATSALSANMQILARSIDQRYHRKVLFNPLPWPRDAVIDGKLIQDIPAGGHMTLPDEAVTSTKPVPAGNEYENSRFKIVIDPERGAIRSLVHKASGRDLVDANSPHGFGQYLHERFSADEVAAYCHAYIRGGKNAEDYDNYSWAYAQIGKPNMPDATEAPYRADTARFHSITRARTGATTTLTLTAAPDQAGIDYPVTTRIHLHDHADYLDLELTINKPADNWPEAGWICLPFKIDTPRFRVGRHGFIMDPAKDIVPGTNRHMYAVGTGVAVFDGQGRGVGVCGPDTPLVSLGTPGCWKFDRNYVPKKPVVYFNLFNNQWTTNYRFWNEGEWTYRFRIWAYENYDPASSLVTPSLETLHPVLTAGANIPRGGPLPTRQAGLQVSRSGVMVTAFAANPRGKGRLLRVWEQAGTSGPLTITLPEAATAIRATPIDLRGRITGEAVRIRDGILTFDLPANAPASFILE